MITFIIFTILFFLIIDYNKQYTRSNKYDSKSFDGNGIFQYKGRGYSKEDIEILLSRIDWLAKNSEKKSLYSTSYIVAYAIMLSVIVILYAYSEYIVSDWEIALILISSFIITFSILNLFNFHTERYTNYYIRNNLKYIAKQLRIKLKEPPLPHKKSSIPHRTVVQDILTF